MTERTFRFYEATDGVRVYDAKPTTSSWRAIIKNRLEIIIWVRYNDENEDASEWKSIATFEEGTPFETVKEATRNFLRLGMDTGNRRLADSRLHSYEHWQKV